MAGLGGSFRCGCVGGGGRRGRRLGGARASATRAVLRGRGPRPGAGSCRQTPSLRNGEQGQLGCVLSCAPSRPSRSWRPGRRGWVWPRRCAGTSLAGSGPRTGRAWSCDGPAPSGGGWAVRARRRRWRAAGRRPSRGHAVPRRRRRPPPPGKGVEMFGRDGGGGVGAFPVVQHPVLIDEVAGRRAVPDVFGGHGALPAWSDLAARVASMCAARSLSTGRRRMSRNPIGTPRSRSTRCRVR